MCDCFHLAFPNWHAAPSGTAGRRLQAPEPATEDNSICEELAQFAEGERPRPQGSSPVQEYPEVAKHTDSDKECEAEHDPDHKAGTGHKGKKSGLGSIFERTPAPKISKSQEAQSPEGGFIVNTAKDGCAEGLVYGGGGKDGIFIKKVVPESPASKSLKVKEGDQILSATVYFDNMSYEDAIQILEHAQAYKLKLCLKRQTDITETEPAIKSDIIPEEEVSSTEIREQGKTRRRRDARISWPKFPSFGKGRKSRFTRSHSSSEADEQRKLELSPTTSDTESPIKSQDALKGKKKHKIKLSALTKRGRISSSEDQDTDATTGQMSCDIQQKQESDTLTPEFPEYPLGKTLEVNVQADKKAEKGIESDQKSQTTSNTQNIQHKVELISMNSALKTTDLTVALTDQESQSGTPKSPDEKQKKKEKSELKMKILGKDKLHKKEAKAKSSPKRLKTLGASVDTEDLPETGKSDVLSSSESKTKLLGDQSTVSINNKIQSSDSSKVIPSKSITAQISLPKVELGISVRKSPKKGDEKTQKGKDIKKKQSKMSSPKLKQPEIDIDMMNIATSEEMQKANDQESTTETGRVSITQLPKREDIEIPGMEDMAMKTTTTRKKEPKADLKIRKKEGQAETVQMSIDVDSVKEAVSKLPGFKLPQVDISGVPIREEITVIDANAQRISVKTPTKVAKPKQEDHLIRSDMTASSELSKTMFLAENKIAFEKYQKEEKTGPTECKKEEETMVFKKQDIVISCTEVSILQEKEFNRTNGKIESELAATKEPQSTSIKPKVTMPSFGMSAKSRRLPYIGIDLQKQTFIQGKELKTETSKDERQTGEVICEVPELDGIEYIDSTDESSVKKDGGLTSFDMSTHAKTSAILFRSKENDDEPKDGKNELFKFGITPSDIPSGKEDIVSDEVTTKPLDRDGKSTFEWQDLDISLPKLKGATVDIITSKKDTAVTETQVKGRPIPGGPEKAMIKSSGIDVPEETARAEKPVMKTEPVETQRESDKEASKFAKFGIKMPKIKGPEFNLSLSKKVAHDKLSPDTAEGPLLGVSEIDVTPGKINASFLKQKMELEKAGVEVKPLQTKGEYEQKGKIKMANFEMTSTKLKGPEISVSKKDADFILPEAKPELKLIESLETDVNKDISGQKQKIGIEQFDLKIKSLQSEGEVKGHQIKMPQLGIVLPKVTVLESDISLSKKGKDPTLPEVKGEIKEHDVEGNRSSTKLDVRAHGIKVTTKNFEGSSSKFKKSPFKMPRFGAATPTLSSNVSDTQSSEVGVTIDTDVGPPADVKTKAPEIDGRASKFKVPKFGISLPKLRGPETGATSSKKVVDVDVILLEGEAEVKLIDAEPAEPGLRLEGKTLQMAVQQDFDYSASKSEIIVLVPEAKEVKLSQVDGEKGNFSSPVALSEIPELEIQAESQLHGREGKIKLPRMGITLPKVKGPEFHLGVSGKAVDVMAVEDQEDLQNTETMLPDTETKVGIPVPTADVSLGKAEILIPTGKVEVGKPEVHTQPILEETRGRLKMPKLGITMSKGKGPETTKDVEVIHTESKRDAKIPDADFKEQDVKQSPSQFNMPTFRLPKLGLGSPSSTTRAYPSDKNAQRDGIDMDIPDEVLAVTIAASSTDTEGPFIDMKTIEADHEGKTHRFKMPNLGFSVPQIKVHDSDIDVTQQKTKAEDKLGDAEQKNKGTEEDSKAPDINVVEKDKQRSQGKFKMPTFKLPKFGVAISTTNEEHSTVGKYVIVDGDNIEIPEAIIAIDSRASSSSLEGKSEGEKITETKHESKEIESKIPHLGLSGPDTDLGLSSIDIDANIIERKADVKLNDDLNKCSSDIKDPAPIIKVLKKEKEGSPSKFKMPTFKLPKFGLSAQSSTEEGAPLDEDVKTGGGETTTSGESFPVSTEGTSIDIKDPPADLKMTGPENEERENKFKLPSLGFSVSQTKGPDTEINLSKTDVDVKVPDVKMKDKVPDEKCNISSEVEVKAPEVKGIKTEKEGSPSKFKMPTFKLPKFGLSAQSSTKEVPPLDKDIKTGASKTTTSGEGFPVSTEGTSIDIRDPSTDLKITGTENEERKTKFKPPSLDFSVSQTKGPDTEIKLSKTDIDVTVPDVKMEVKVPDEKCSISSEVEAKAPEFKGMKTEKEGSPSKFKMPTFKLPKFGLSAQSSTKEVPPLDKDLKTGASVTTTSGEGFPVSTEGTSIDIKDPPEDLKITGTENEGRGRKFELPSLGFSVSQTKGPDTEINLSKTDVDVTVPDVKMEVKVPDEKCSISSEVEAKAPEVKGMETEKEGSPSKFKMPTFKLPKFGLSAQSSTKEVPPLDKDLKTGASETTTSGEGFPVSTEGTSIDIKDPPEDLKITGTENEGRGRKFELPSLDFSVSQTKGPDTEIKLSKTDVDVTVPDVKMEVKVPDEKFNISSEVEAKAPEFKGMKTEKGSPSKFKMPTFKLPKFGLSAQSSTKEVPPLDKDIKTGGDETTMSYEVIAGSTEGPKFEIRGPSVESKTEGSEREREEKKFKLPSLGFSVTQTKGPDMDLSLKTDRDVTQPELKAKVKIPDDELKIISTETETKGPDIQVVSKDNDGSPSKFKMPTFKFPKFGVATPSSTEEVPSVDKDLKTGGCETTASEEVLRVTVEGPNIEIKGTSVDINTVGSEHEGKEEKFKPPCLSFLVPQAKEPDTDLSLKTDIDVTLPAVKAEVELPDDKLNKSSVEVETKALENKNIRKDKDGSPSKFKMPGLDFSVSQTKGPDTEIKLSKTDVDVTVPDVKMEVKVPDEKFNISSEVEAKAPEFKGMKTEKEGSPSKFKMPTFKLPKFGLSAQSSMKEVPPLDKDIKTGGDETTMSYEVIAGSTEGPKFEIRGPSVESKTEGSEREREEKKFKLPSLGFSVTQTKGPDMDLSLKTDRDVTQPELKAKVKIPDDELKIISTETETKRPDIQVVSKDNDGSPSKFKMPTFKFPKFGVATPSSTEEVPSVDKDLKTGGCETTASEEVLRVTVEGPNIEIKGTSVDINTVGSEHEGKEEKFKSPSLSFLVPQAKEPDTDLSLKTDIDVTLPAVKAEVELPDDKLNKSSVEVETKALENKNIRKDKDGSPSKFKMPNFKLPKFRLAAQSSTGEVLPGVGETTISEEVIAVTTPSMEIKGPLLEPKTEGSDREGKGKKFKLPSLGFSVTEVKGADTELGLSKREVDVTLPEVKTEVKFPDDDLKNTSTAIEAKEPEIKTVVKETDGSPSKFKMPAFKLPKFGLATQSSTGEGPQLDKKEEDEAELKNTVTAMETKAPEIKVVSKDSDGSPSKFKMPTFKLPKCGLATQSSNEQVPALDKDVKTVKGDSTTLEKVLTVTTEEPSIENKDSSIDLECSETDNERRGHTFKLPSLGFSMAKAKGPETGITLSTTNVDVTVPEVNAEVPLSDAKIKQPSVQMEIKSPDTAYSGEIEAVSEVKMSKITLPKFGVTTPHLSVEIPDVTKEKRIDVEPNVDIKPIDVNAEEWEQKKYQDKVEVQLSSAEAKGEDVPTVEFEGKIKRLNWTFPSISFSRTGGKAPDVDVNIETPKAGVTPTESKICLPEADVKESPRVPTLEASPAAESDTNLKKSKFSLPKFSFSKSSMKEPEVKAKLPDRGVKIEHVDTKLITEVKLSADEDKNDSTGFETAASEAKVKSKDAKGSPSKFKMPTLKMPRFGSASYEVTTETRSTDKIAEGDGSHPGEDPTVIFKGPKIDVKTDASKLVQPDHETLNTESDSAVHGSPSKFRLPAFKIPRLSLSRSKPEDESAHAEHEKSEDQLEMKIEQKEENISPKLAITSFGDILKSTDVDIDVRKFDQNLETSTESHEPVVPVTKHTDAKDKEAKSKQDTTKSPESSGWFKFPKFGLSSPVEQQKILDKVEQIKDSSPVGETRDEEGSPTFSVQSSDAFADISSTITSEPAGSFLPSPTKVMIKNMDDSAAAGLGEMHGGIMTSTTRTELITEVANLPEKITILSSGVSSSSEDTIRLKSGKIHIITSNIQATPESQHAKLLTAVQIQSAEGLALQSEVDEASPWTVQDPLSAPRTVFEKHLIQETSTERSESKETLVITKQITHVFGTTEPISGETASSIQRLKDSVHSEKMRFFDEAEK